MTPKLQALHVISEIPMQQRQHINSTPVPRNISTQIKQIFRRYCTWNKDNICIRLELQVENIITNRVKFFHRVLNKTASQSRLLWNLIHKIDVCSWKSTGFMLFRISNQTASCLCLSENLSDDRSEEKFWPQNGFSLSCK